jgi:hypothetical protein
LAGQNSGSAAHQDQLCRTGLTLQTLIDQGELFQPLFFIQPWRLHIISVRMIAILWPNSNVRTMSSSAGSDEMFCSFPEARLVYQ